MTIYRSSGGNKVARRWTSAVNEDPSGVLVKLKNGTRESNFVAAEIDLCTSVDGGSGYGRGDCKLGRMGVRGAVRVLPQKCFEGDLVLGLWVLGRSEWERDVKLPNEATDAFSGEYEK